MEKAESRYGTHYALANTAEFLAYASLVLDGLSTTDEYTVRQSKKDDEQMSI